MSATMGDAMGSFCVGHAVLPDKRNLKKVPFVELQDRRLQGVVSSGSDQERVYVSWLESGSGDFYCSTNNNRPCGGLRGGPCKHIDALFDNAVAQYGAPRVAHYLGSEAASASAAAAQLGGAQRKEGSGEVFSRFLDYLRYMELPEAEGDAPELAWFVSL